MGRQELRDQLSDAFAKIRVIAETFEHPEKYVKMSESEYVDYINSEAKRRLSDGQEDK